MNSTPEQSAVHNSMFREGAATMTGVGDVETARIAEDEREVVGERRRGDSGWEQMGIRSWFELEYAAVVEDSDRILADALTPAARVLLTRLAAGTLEPAASVPPIRVLRSSYRVPVMRPRATQRSPPQEQGARAGVSLPGPPDGAAGNPSV